MSHRIDYAKASPEGYKAFGGVYVTVQNGSLPKSSISSICGYRRSMAAPSASTCIRTTC
ncbi:MAG: hypothetical protein JF625_16790 [Inquilinus limosus]|uniref:Uncharacterized protein n=1 Tax=Inquilinus limosus TaxID=171674 RepID=A0A952FP85_9PROT|nr:hypothetical protein [Inquilinus limosus]